MTTLRWGAAGSTKLRKAITIKQTTYKHNGLFIFASNRLLVLWSWAFINVDTRDEII